MLLTEVVTVLALRQALLVCKQCVVKCITKVHNHTNNCKPVSWYHYECQLRIQLVETLRRKTQNLNI